MVQDHQPHNSIRMIKELNIMLNIKFNSLPSTGEHLIKKKSERFSLLSQRSERSTHIPAVAGDTVGFISSLSQQIRQTL